jgi:hemoglobin-like flavoprotein
MNVTLLRQSFEQIVEREPQLTKRFYEILFARYPHLRAMFRGDSTTQEKMLAGALAAVMDHLEDAAWLVPTLESLGARHVQYGVTDEMYDQVGDCLMQALAEASGPEWKFDLIIAWSQAFGFIAATMKRGAARLMAA